MPLKVIQVNSCFHGTSAGGGFKAPRCGSNRYESSGAGWEVFPVPLSVPVGLALESASSKRIPLSVLIYHVQPCVPLTLHSLSPDFQKALNFTGQIPIGFPAYYFLTFIPVFWRGSQQNLGKEEKLKEIPTILVHHQSPHTELASPQTKIPGFHLSLDWAPQNSQGKMFSHWCGRGSAWMALLQNVPQVTASAWVECLTHANVLFARTAGVIPFIKTHGSRPCSSRNCHSSSSSELLIC